MRPVFKNRIEFLKWEKKDREEKMRPKENTAENVGKDYWFLRNNKVCSRTALKMIGKAYAQKISIQK